MGYLIEKCGAYQKMCSFVFFFLAYVTAAFAGDATLSWDPNDWNINPDLSGYKIYYGTDPSTYTQVIDIGLINPDAPTYTVGNLTEDNTYYFAVTAYDSAGNESGFSGEAFKTITNVSNTTDTTPPGDVQNFTALGGDQEITLSWTNPPDSDFVGVRIVYRIDRFPDDINDGILLGDFTGQPDINVSTLHSGLDNDITYYYIASSYDGHGNFQSTAYASATTSTVVSSNNTEDQLTTLGAGCGMIIPVDGKPPGPGKMADMMAIGGMILLIWIKKKVKSIKLITLDF